MEIAEKILLLNKKIKDREKKYQKNEGQLEYLEQELKKEIGYTNIKKIKRKIEKLKKGLKKEEKELQISVKKIEGSL